MFKDNKSNTINLKIPRNWTELDDRQLLYVFGLIADEYSLEQVIIFCFCRFGGIRVVYSNVDEVCCKVKGREFVMKSDRIAELAQMLRYLGEPPAVPVRPSCIGRSSFLRKAKTGTALPADFQQVPFRKFLFLENLYQGFLSTRNNGLLADMARILYQNDKLTPSQAEGLACFYWFTSLKRLFSQQFPNFFKPSRDDGSSNLLGQSLGRKLQESMDSQIRALTKGDVTKEREVLDVDTWRALAELDALAREADELNRKYPNT